jgi:cytochrome c
MNRKILFSTLISLAAASLLSAGEGEALFKSKCTMCHSLSIPKDMKSMIAPPAEGIAMHVKMAHHDKEAFIAFITDYALHPSAEKALCEKRTVKRFGIMPSQKDNVSEEELKKIAGYLYENFALGGHLHEKHRMMKERLMHGMQAPQQGKIQMH